MSPVLHVPASRASCSLRALVSCLTLPTCQRQVLMSSHALLTSAVCPVLHSKASRMRITAPSARSACEFLALSLKLYISLENWQLLTVNFDTFLHVSWYHFYILFTRKLNDSATVKGFFYKCGCKITKLSCWSLTVTYTTQDHCYSFWHGYFSENIN